MNDLQTIKLTFDSFIEYTDDKQDLQFQINEDCVYVKLIINDKIYNVHKDCFIKLGKSCLPLKYKELETNGYKSSEKYYGQ